MNIADDIAYSVHDVEDGVVAGRIDLSALDTAAVWDTVRDWYLPGTSDDRLDRALAGLRSVAGWPTSPYDGTRRRQAALKNLTSDLIGRFCAAIRTATFRSVDGALARHETDVFVPPDSSVEMGVLKGIAAHYVMKADDRVRAMTRQRELLAELVELLVKGAPETLERSFASDWAEAADEAGRRRAVVDQVASLTDSSALTWHTRLRGR
jgi:dGTPase